MSTEDLAYKDLAEWRENEAKRQLDLIEKNEQENMGLSNRYLIKTHKGEEIIENVFKEVDGGEEISVKIEIALPELANDTTPQYKSQRIAERSRSSLSSSHSIKEKDRKKSNSSSSGREKVSSRGLESSGRHSDSGSKRSDHHRRDGDKKKDAKDHDLHRPRSKDDIPKQAKSSSIKKVVVDKELYDSSQPLNSDDAVPISGSFILWPIKYPLADFFIYFFLTVALKDKLAAQQKEKDRPLNSHDDVPKPGSFILSPFKYLCPVLFIYFFLTAATTKMAKSDPKSIRSFSRDSLKDALWSRCKEAKDLESDESIVEQIAEEIENSLFSLFKNVGVKYKNKYRSLIYNIKDKKNPTLFRKIITKQITPGKFSFS